MFDQNDNNDTRNRGLRSVQDICPACAGQATQQPTQQAASGYAHIDTYNGQSQSCNPTVVGDYGYYYAIRLG